MTFCNFYISPTPKKSSIVIIFAFQIFDAVIIVCSFAIDLVFLNGLGEAPGEEAAALLIVFLLWRILRVINGIKAA